MQVSSFKKVFSSKQKFTVFVISVATSVLSLEIVNNVAIKLKNPHPVTFAECLLTIQNYKKIKKLKNNKKLNKLKKKIKKYY